MEVFKQIKKVYLRARKRVLLKPHEEEINRQIAYAVGEGCLDEDRASEMSLLDKHYYLLKSEVYENEREG